MLTTEALHDGSLDRAAGELLRNAGALALAGFAKDAHRALSLLFAEGPWRVPAHGALVGRLQRMVPQVSLLAGEGCPAIGKQDAIPLAAQQAWAEEEAAGQVRNLARVSRTQLKPAGTDWSPPFLATLADRRGGPDEPRQHLAFGAFCGDADFVLKDRIAQHFGCSTAAVDVPSAEELQAAGLPDELLQAMLQQLKSAGSIEIADAAKAIDTLATARAVIGYQRATGFPGGYLANDVLLASCLLLIDEGRDAEAADVATAWMASDENAVPRLLDLAPVPSVARFFQAGALAPAMGIAADAVQRWLAALNTRQAPASPPPLSSAPTSAQPSSALAQAVAGTPLAGLTWLEVPVLDTGEHAWVASIPVGRRKPLWDAARAIVHVTSRWPVVTTFWSGASADAPDIAQLGDELFNRFPYEQGPARDDVSPASFIATAESVVPDDILRELEELEEPLDAADQVAIWQSEIEASGLQLADFDQAWQVCHGDRLRFERWLAEQEDAQGKADPELGRDPGFEPDNVWLVLLPSARSEDTLAYVHWYGMERGPGDGFIALLRHWREQYGAELFAHYGTMLEFVVHQPPQDMDAAMELAHEHSLAAPCTLILPGTPLRHYARGLIGREEWFLHERP